MRVNRLFCSIIQTRLALCIAFLMVMTNLQAQNSENTDPSLIEINGVVRDAKTKLPIAYAQIKSLNWQAAATADSAGAFKILLKSDVYILSVAAFDYGIREFNIRGNKDVVIELYSDIFSTPYKPVETLIGMRNSTFVTQSINSINSITKSPYITIDNEIQSKLGGNIRAISRSGVTGIGACFNIRGINSIVGNTQPLFVVNGEIWDNTDDVGSLHNGFYINPLLTIDMADIESVTVLKDGISLYGTKGANGVVLIKTKQKKGEVTKITFSGFYGITDIPAKVPVMNASEFRTYASEILKINEYDPQVLASYFLNDNTNWPKYARYHNSTNWQDNIYDVGRTQSYALSINGGDDKASYNFSLGYTGDKGVLKTTDLQRVNMRLVADINFTKDLFTKWNIGYSNIQRNMLDDGVNYFTSPSFVSMVKAPFLYPYKYTVDGNIITDFEDSDDFGVSNPDAIIGNSDNYNKQYRFNIGVTPEYRLSKNLSIKNSFNYSIYNVRENFYRPLIGVDSLYYVNRDFVSRNMNQNYQYRNISLFNDLKLQYNQTLAYYHNINLIAGTRYLNTFAQLDYGEGHNTPDDNYRGLDNASKKFTDGYDNKAKSISNYFNIDYSFKNRYFLTTAMSMDASSRFGKEIDGAVDFMGRKWGLFYNVNGAWLLSAERFMQNFSFINLFKVRAGYGVTGNDDIGYYSGTPFLKTVKYISTSNGLVIGDIANNGIKWETTSRLNAGVDLSLLNEKVQLSCDLYKSKTKDLLSLKDLPYYSGDDYFWVNSGELSNKGFEVSANFKLLNQKSLKWEVGLSAGHYKNEIVSLPDGSLYSQLYKGGLLTSVGNPAFVFYGYKTQGVFATQAEADKAKLVIVDEEFDKRYQFNAGDVRFVDINHDSIINESDKQIIGDPNPDIYGSFTSMVAYKNFTLDLLFTYSYGNDVYNYLRSELESGSNIFNQSPAMLNRWKINEQQTSQPRAQLGDPMGNARFSDRWIEDGSYLKLKTVTLAYKVPVKIKSIEEINVWFSVNNVFTITNYLGRDPEFSVNNSVYAQGIDVGLLPNLRSYFIGVKLNL